MTSCNQSVGHVTGEEGHVTSLTSWRAACDISARSFGLPTNYERPIVAFYRIKNIVLIKSYATQNLRHLPTIIHLYCFSSTAAAVELYLEVAYLILSYDNRNSCTPPVLRLIDRNWFPLFLSIIVAKLEEYKNNSVSIVCSKDISGCPS